GDLDLGIKMGSPVLQRLELADKLPELLALPEIIEGSPRRPRRDADQLRGGAGASSGERTLERLHAGVDLADHRIGIELDIVKAQPRRLGAVDQGCDLDLKPGRAPWYCKQCHPLRFP